MTFVHVLYRIDAVLSHICFDDTATLAVYLISSKKLLIALYYLSDAKNNQIVTNMDKPGTRVDSLCR